jgi:uncharacterized membrane protein YdbT with pleckstrin-like domain
MSYVQRVLQPGEQVRHIYTLDSVLARRRPCTPSGGRLLAQRHAASDRIVAAYALALVAVVLLIREWFQWWVTDIAVTNRRVIYKKGLIRRQTNEMNMDKVESVQVKQSILGRMLDYGTVTILGTGEGFETLRTIASPIELRNSITGA